MAASISRIVGTPLREFFNGIEQLHHEFHLQGQHDQQKHAGGRGKGRDPMDALEASELPVYVDEYGELFVESTGVERIRQISYDYDGGSDVFDVVIVENPDGSIAVDVENLYGTDGTVESEAALETYLYDNGIDDIRWEGERGTLHASLKAAVEAGDGTAEDVFHVKVRDAYSGSFYTDSGEYEIGDIRSFVREGEGPGNVEIAGKIYDAEGTVVGKFRRSVYDNGVVYNHSLDVYPQFQGNGIGTAFLDSTEAALGATEFRLAAVNVGKYAWAARGYRLQPQAGSSVANYVRDAWIDSARTINQRTVDPDTANRVEAVLSSWTADINQVYPADLLAIDSERFRDVFLQGPSWDAVREVDNLAAAAGVEQFHMRGRHNQRNHAGGAGLPDVDFKDVRIAYRPRHPDGKADPGEVVWAQVPFEERDGRSKDRPVLIIGRTKDGKNLVGVQLTSKPGRDRVSVGTGDWDRQGRESFMDTTRFIQVDDSNYRREGAYMKKPRFQDIADVLTERQNAPDVDLAVEHFHLQGQHDQQSHAGGSAKSGLGYDPNTEIPTNRPGEAEIPEGAVRLTHRTWSDNVDSIMENGLGGEHARQYDFEGEVVWAAAGVAYGQEAIGGPWQAESDITFFEFWMMPDELIIGNGDDPAWLESSSAHVTMRDVPPERFVGVYEPWHAAYWAFESRTAGTFEEVKSGFYDSVGEANPDTYGKAMDYIKDQQLAVQVFHLQGEHDQQTHAGGRAKGGIPEGWETAPAGYTEEAQAEWAAGAAYLAEGGEMPDFWKGLDYIGEDGLPVGGNEVGFNYDESTIEETTALREKLGPEVAGGIWMMARHADQLREEAIHEAIAMNEISPEDAEARYRYDSRADHAVNGWEPLPERLYHATSKLSAIAADGTLKSRREIGGREAAAGLGGGTDNTISFTSDRAIAEGIARSLHDARRALNMSPEELVAELEQRSGDWWPRVRDSARNVHGVDGVPKTIEEQYDLFRSFTYQRQINDGVLDPLFFNVNPANLRDMDPADIGIVEVAPAVTGAKGYQVSSLGEWRVPTGRTVDITQIEQRDDPGQFAVQVFHLQGQHDQQNHAGGRARHGYEHSADALIEDPLEDLTGDADPSVSDPEVRGEAKFRGANAIGDEMTALEQTMVREGLGAYGDDPWLRSFVREEIEWSKEIGLRPDTYPDMPMAYVLQAAHVGRYLNTLSETDIAAYDRERLKAESIVDEMHDLMEGTNNVGPDYEEGLANFTYRMETEFGVSPGAGFVGALNNKWQDSSQHHLCQAHQMAVANLRGHAHQQDGIPESMEWLRDSAEWPNSLKHSKLIYSTWQPAFDATAAATYRYTQSKLPDSPTFSVYRGVKDMAAVNTEFGDFAAEVNPLSSWSSSPDTAYEFGGRGWVFEVQVPREFVYSTSAISGMGSLPEWEVVITADDMLAARVVNRDPATDQAVTIDEMYEIIEGRFSGSMHELAAQDRVVVPVDELDADWLKRVGRPTVEVFHLEGTPNDHDQSTHARKNADGETIEDVGKTIPEKRDPDDILDEWMSSPEEFAAARALAAEKARNVPKPTQDQIDKNRAMLEKSKRPGGWGRGNSYTRRARAQALFEEFGGKPGGSCPCSHCGIKVSPGGEGGFAKLTQDKILVASEGGTYGTVKKGFPNLIPACGGCNSSRNEASFPVRPEWEVPEPVQEELPIAASASTDVDDFEIGADVSVGEEFVAAKATGRPVGWDDWLSAEVGDDPVTGEYVIRSVDTWFGPYDQHLVGGEVCDPETITTGEELALQVFHLQGQHDQADHGNRGGTAVLDSPAAALAAGEKVTMSAAEAVDALVEIGKADDGVVDMTNLTLDGNPYLFTGVPADGRRSRGDMPQVPEAALDRFHDHLEDEGVTFTNEVIDPASVKSTQTELDATKVGQMIGRVLDGNYTTGHDPWISNDGYILDGHHRWGTMAVLSAAGIEHPPFNVQRVSLPIDELLILADEFNDENNIKAKTIDMTVQVFHLQGQHDQQSHAGGRGVSAQDRARARALVEAAPPVVKNKATAEHKAAVEALQAVGRQVYESAYSTLTPEQKSILNNEPTLDPDVFPKEHDAKRRVEQALAERAMASLREVRQFGRDPDFKAFGDDPEFTQAIEDATEMYPREWMASSYGVEVKASGTTGGWYENGVIGLPKYGDTDAAGISRDPSKKLFRVAVHELGHHLEMDNPAVLKSSQMFLATRKDGALKSGSSVGLPSDKRVVSGWFRNSYTGAFYGATNIGDSDSTEVLTTHMYSMQFALDGPSEPNWSTQDVSLFGPARSGRRIPANLGDTYLEETYYALGVLASL